MAEVKSERDDEQIIRKSLVGATEIVAMEITASQAKRPSQETNDWRNKKIKEEEQFIEEVHKRPALWNHKLPLIERTLQMKKKLWEEIYASMNGAIDIPLMKKKWKSLSDCFRVYKNKQNQPSGSMTTRKNTWVHFDRLQFLYDVQLENESITNISVSNPPENSENNNMEESYDAESFICDGNSSSSGRGSRNSKKRRFSIDDSVDEILDRFSDGLRQPITVNIPTFMHPTSSLVDKVTLYGNLVTALLKEIDSQLVDKVMVQVLQILNAAKSKTNRKE